MEMTSNEASDWNGFHTPVIFNHHSPIEVNSSTISHFDLNPIKSTDEAVKRKEKILILTPLRDASPYLTKYFELVAKLSYPHELIDLAFLVGDSSDDTMAVLASELERVQGGKGGIAPFHSARIIEKDFGGIEYGQGVEDRHSFEAQGPRRKAIARARNYLLYSALQPEHSWVYWRDVDIVGNPPEIIQDMVSHNTDIIVPSTLGH